MRKHYSPAFKAKVVTELLTEEKTVTQIAPETGVSTKQLIRWRDLALTELPWLFETKGDDCQANSE
jgi:putative transposase